MKAAKLHTVKAVASALGAMCLVTHAEAKPWWWPCETPVKTSQVALPSNNGVVVSVTIPAASPAKAGSIKQGGARRGTRSSTADQRDDERIAADLERHF
jgi:hypothetical protein